MASKIEKDAAETSDKEALAQWIKRKLVNHEPFHSKKRVSDEGFDRKVLQPYRKTSIDIPDLSRDRVIYTLEDGREFAIIVVALHEQGTFATAEID